MRTATTGAACLATYLIGVGCIMLITVVGCGGSTGGMVDVTGIVKMAGAPVAKGNITFTPVAGGRPSKGEIQSDGSYRLSTKKLNDGVMPGEYLVVIKVVEVQGAVQEGVAPDLVWIVPERYASVETSELTANVNDSGASQTIDFDIPAE